MTFTPDPDRGISQEIERPSLTELLKAPRENGAVLLGARVQHVDPLSKGLREGTIESLSGAESWHVRDGQKVHVESWSAAVRWGPADGRRRPEYTPLTCLEVVSLEA